MRKHILVFVLSVISLSCNKVDKITHFDMEYETQITIPSTIGVNLPLNLYSPNITTNSETVFDLHDTKARKVEKINLTSLNMNVANPVGKNFNFLKTLRLFITADDLPEIEVAWIVDHTDDDATSLNLSVIPDDLKDYIIKESFSLRAESVTDQIITHDYTINVLLTYWVDARVLGL